jgi:hypothetical protein
MDVPDMMLKVGLRSNLGGPTWNGHAASTLTPGPVMSGFRIPGLWMLGPREEKEVMAGAGDVPRTVPWKKEIIASGFDVDLM